MSSEHLGPDETTLPNEFEFLSTLPEADIAHLKTVSQQAAGRLATKDLFPIAQAYTRLNRFARTSARILLELHEELDLRAVTASAIANDLMTICNFSPATKYSPSKSFQQGNNTIKFTYAPIMERISCSVSAKNSPSVAKSTYPPTLATLLLLP